MNATQQNRLIFPDEHCIVVFDTSPLRNLAYLEEAPNWIDTFRQMSQDNYYFSISDGACAELLIQRAEGRIPDAGFRRMLDWIEPFLNIKVPVFPGKRDIMELIHCSSEEHEWCEDEFFRLSELAWQFLKDSSESSRRLHTSAELVLQEERDHWIALFKQMRKKIEQTSIPPTELDERGGPILSAAFAQMDAECNCTPPMSIRTDLQLRLAWRQYVRSEKIKQPYDPESFKKRNDGIDFDLYRYFLLPAFVVADDRGFFNALEGIESFQRGWFCKPEELAEAWQEGERPKPNWPTAQ